MHPVNSFVTLTFDDDHMPASGSVAVRDLQLFMKRLRFSNSEQGLGPVRFFACGEYSPQNLRPHYHLLLFNQAFPDKRLFKDENGKRLYLSSRLQSLWSNGFSTIGDVNYQTARYCAQYSLKKITGQKAKEHYLWPHPVTGHLVQVQPEFVTMSRRPGIGHAWFQKFQDDCYPSDFIIVDGKKHTVPKYYDKLIKREAEALGSTCRTAFDKIKRKRAIKGSAHKADNTPDRLAVREEILQAKLKQSKRQLGTYE